MSASGKARVSGNGRVYGNAKVSNSARVYGNAWVSGDASVSDNALVYGNASVSGGRIYADANIAGPRDLVQMSVDGVCYARFRCADGSWRITSSDGSDIPDRIEAALRCVTVAL